MATGFRGLDPAPPLPANAPATLLPFFQQVVGYLARLREVVNNLLRGKLNATLDVTLNVGSTNTVINDPRIGGSSAICLMPLTANAAAEIGNGTIWWSAEGDQTATLSHASNAQADRTFRLTIIG